MACKNKNSDNKKDHEKPEKLITERFPPDIEIYYYTCNTCKRLWTESNKD
jgi:hypothetical protein